MINQAITLPRIIYDISAVSHVTRQLHPFFLRDIIDDSSSGLDCVNESTTMIYTPPTPV